MKSRDDHIAFIRLNRVPLSSLAWQRHQEIGRGMICVMCNDHNQVLGTVPYEFLPASKAASLIDEWEGSKEQRLVREYDPDLEMIVCFLNEDEGERISGDTYRITPSPSPKEAAERE